MIEDTEKKASTNMLLKTLTRILAILTVVFSLGCASAYYRNPCCSIDCRYDARNPLPYTNYDPCVCHSDAASHYLEPEPLQQPAFFESDTPVSAGLAVPTDKK